MDFGAVSKQLRQLTNERDAGTLAPAKYRLSRGRLLDQLLGLPPRSEDLEMTRPRSAPLDSAVIQTAQSAAVVHDATAAPTHQRGRSFLILGMVAVVASVGAALLWFRFTAPRPGNASEVATAVDKALPPAVPVDSIIADFLLRDEWGDKSVSAFNTRWRNLSEDDVVAALGNSRGQQLSRRLGEQLQRHVGAEPDGLQGLEANSPLLIMAANLKVPVPDGAMASHSLPAEVRTEPLRRDAISSSAVPSGKALNDSGNDHATAVAADSRIAPVAVQRPATEVATSSLPPNSAIDGRPSGSDYPVASDPCSEANLTARRRTCVDVLPDGRSGPRLRVIKADSFSMGSIATPAEQPVHPTRIAHSFAIMESEVTVGDYAYYCQQTHRPRPAAPWPGDGLPVVNVSWNDARDYAAWLSKVSSQQYRLPTEAEWEYAARAGGSGEPGFNGVPLLNSASEARYSPTAAPSDSPTNVEDPSYKANAWGLHHMLGNVREWVEDNWIADYSHAPVDGSAAINGSNVRVVRGGDYRDGPAMVRPGARAPADQNSHDVVTGFRLIRVQRTP